MIVGSALLYDHSAIDRPATILLVAQQFCAKNTHKLRHQKDSNNKNTLLDTRLSHGTQNNSKRCRGKERWLCTHRSREADEVVEDDTIEGAVNIPLGQLIRKGRQGELDDLKGKTICTYCNVGYRGNIGADELNKKGFSAVTVDGGYAAWKE